MHNLLIFTQNSIIRAVYLCPHHRSNKHYMQHRSSQISWSKVGIGLVAVVSIAVNIAPAIARLDLSPKPDRPNQPNVPPAARSILKIGNLKTYRHPSGLFSIDTPQRWQMENISKPNHVILRWEDANRDGLIVIQVLRSPGAMTEEEMGERLTKIIRLIYPSNPQLKVNLPVTQPDGSVRVSWSFPKKANNGSTVFYSGNSFLKQHGNKVSANFYVLPSQQYAQLKEPLNQIIRSFQLNDEIDVP